MKAIHILLASLLLPGIVLAQANGQEPNTSSTSDTNLAAEVQALREALSQTQKQLATQQLEIQTLKAQSKAGPVTPAADGLSQVESESRTNDLLSPALGATAAYGMPIAHSKRPHSTTNKQRNRPRALSNLTARFWNSAASSISRTYFVPPTPRTTSQRHLDPYRSATRLRDRSPNFVPRHNTLGLT